MTDTLLVDAISAIKTKIASSAATATPEELAYLGTAIDRIGGGATAMEVVEFGDQKKTELTALAETKTAEATDAIEAVKTDAISEVNDAIVDMQDAAGQFAQQMFSGRRAYFYGQI